MFLLLLMFLMLLMFLTLLIVDVLTYFSPQTSLLQDWDARAPNKSLGWRVGEGRVRGGCRVLQQRDGLRQAGLRGRFCRSLPSQPGRLENHLTTITIAPSDVGAEGQQDGDAEGGAGRASPKSSPPRRPCCAHLPQAPCSQCFRVQVAGLQILL